SALKRKPNLSFTFAYSSPTNLSPHTSHPFSNPPTPGLPKTALRQTSGRSLEANPWDVKATGLRDLWLPSHLILD
ncbi:unnamed protein product, partial [Candidula unifasciata]